MEHHREDPISKRAPSGVLPRAHPVASHLEPLCVVDVSGLGSPRGITPIYSDFLGSFGLCRSASLVQRVCWPASEPIMQKCPKVLPQCSRECSQKSGCSWECSCFGLCSDLLYDPDDLVGCWQECWQRCCSSIFPMKEPLPAPLPTPSFLPAPLPALLSAPFPISPDF